MDCYKLSFRVPKAAVWIGIGFSLGWFIRAALASFHML